MRKNHYRIRKIHKGEDTPCKSECDYYWDCKKHCSGNCRLIRRWKFIPKTFIWKEHKIINYEEIDGYIYKRIKNGNKF